MEWKAYVWEIVAAAVIIPFIGFVILQVRNWLNSAKEHISLQIPATLEEQKFGLLHVRNGKDEVADHGKIHRPDGGGDQPPGQQQRAAVGPVSQTRCRMPFSRW